MGCKLGKKQPVVLPPRRIYKECGSSASYLPVSGAIVIPQRISSGVHARGTADGNARGRILWDKSFCEFTGCKICSYRKKLPRLRLAKENVSYEIACYIF